MTMVRLRERHHLPSKQVVFLRVEEKRLRKQGSATQALAGHPIPVAIHVDVALAQQLLGTGIGPI
jgi:hypothetical protein